MGLLKAKCYYFLYWNLLWVNPGVLCETILMSLLFSLWVVVTELQTLLTLQPTELAGSVVGERWLDYLGNWTHQGFLKATLKPLLHCCLYKAKDFGFQRCLVTKIPFSTFVFSNYRSALSRLLIFKARVSVRKGIPFIPFTDDIFLPWEFNLTLLILVLQDSYGRGRFWERLCVPG